MSSQTSTPDVIRKNKANDNLVKIELDMDQGSMKAFEQIHDKIFNYECDLWEKFGRQNMFPNGNEYKMNFYFDDISVC